MPQKIIVVTGEDIEITDGFHSFDELYDHRITLFIALARAVLCSLELRHTAQDCGYNPNAAWRSKLHSDGSSLDGWFIMGIGIESGEQVTYHLPLARWDETGFASTLEQAPEWDGHTPQDVLDRLKQICPR